MNTAARLDLSGSRRVHVIGAGGAGMSAIATVLAAAGHRVSGTDAVDSTALQRLADLGVDVRVGHEEALATSAELVVRSTAIPDDDPEVVAARRAGVTLWRRADVLSAICGLKRTVAVSGTHGKTTTSAMLAVTLRELGWRPSLIVGGDIAGLGAGALWDPAGEWLVVEADESDGTFLELGAEAVIVTSVEPDHLEFYGDLAHLVSAFERFVAGAAGPAVVCADDPGAARLASRRTGVLTYGTSSAASARIGDVSLARGGASFSLVLPDGRSSRVSLAVPGLHNVRNAAGVLTLVTAMGAPWPDAASALSSFKGVGRRFESRGEVAGVSFVDGYDHLPTEVAAAVATARSGGWDRVVVIFQPHRYSRTEALWREFGSALAGADAVIVTGIYAAGEAPRTGVSGRLIYDAAAAASRSGAPGAAAAEVYYAEDLDAAATLAAGLLRSGDICLTLGAGDVTRLPDRIIAELAGEGA